MQKSTTDDTCRGAGKTEINNNILMMTDTT